MAVGEADASVVPSSRKKTLVVVIHGMGGSAAKMAQVAETARRAYDGAVSVYVPDLPHRSWLSGRRAAAIVEGLLSGIDAQVSDLAPDRIVLIGHSVGATLARRVFLVAAGWPDNFRPEAGLAHHRPRAWATRVERIVMLAAFSRGWTITPRLSWSYYLLFNLISVIGHLVPGRRDWTPTAFDFRLGAPFMVQTRLHWLAYRRNPPPGILDAERPILVQLLGTQDDLVSPADQVDLAVDNTRRATVAARAGAEPGEPEEADYFLVELHGTTHAQAIELGGDAAGRARGAVVARTLTGTRADLVRSAVNPLLLLDDFDPVDDRVRNVVFVIHGIRDDGYWTHRVAQHVRALDPAPDAATVFRSWTPTYGYFAMLPFVLPWIRREKVEWFADQYVNAFAQYPESDFHYVGHSNGTYLGARALTDYAAIHFRNVLFAGSVVRRDFPWVPLIEQGRVERVQNLLAAGDWVVALLPKSVEWIPAFDLGGAGFDGFRDAGQRPAITEFRYLHGGHSAGVGEAHWGRIAAFVAHGTPFAPDAGKPEAGLYESHPDPTIAALGRLRIGVAAVALLALLLCVLGYKAGGLFGLLVAVVAIKFVVTRL